MPTFTLPHSDADDFTSPWRVGKPIPRGDKACALVRTMDTHHCDAAA